jgi:hypothetical protein
MKIEYLEANCKQRDTATVPLFGGNFFRGAW